MVALASLDDDARVAMAARLQAARDVSLPPLTHFNSDPCTAHRRWVDEVGVEQVDVPKPGCRVCGIRFRRHQRVGVPWLFLVRKGLLADTVGSGKTPHAAGLLALMKQAGEFRRGRALIVLRPTAIDQYARELRRMVPSLTVVTATGTKNQRVDLYCSHWDVCLIGHQMLLRDTDEINRAGYIRYLIVDDVDPLRNRNRTAWAVKKIALDCDRVVIATATPLQKKLDELYRVLEIIGGRDLLGSWAAFQRRYVRLEKQWVYNRRLGKRIAVDKPIGYKNVAEFKEIISPLVLRRTAGDIDDVDLPSIITNNVMLDLYPEQRRVYEDLRKDVRRIITQEGEKIERLSAMAKMHVGAKICTGFPALGEPDGPERAVKLDWVYEQITGDWEEAGDKAVVFIYYKDSIRALAKRLTEAGVGFVTMSGMDLNKERRAASIQRFWDDPTCRVMLGTTTIEQSLNLQCARHLVNVDMLLNPARMEQLAGRIRRDGSPFRSVYVHNLLCRDTQEDGYLPLLEKEQAVIDTVWDEESELFERLSPLALLQLIAS